MDYVFPEDITTDQQKRSHLEELLRAAPIGSSNDPNTTWFHIKRILDDLNRSLS